MDTILIATIVILTISMGVIFYIRYQQADDGGERLAVLRSLADVAVEATEKLLLTGIDSKCKLDFAVSKFKILLKESNLKIKSEDTEFIISLIEESVKLMNERNKNGTVQRDQ